jgi:hypothetical protein
MDLSPCLPVHFIYTHEVNPVRRHLPFSWGKLNIYYSPSPAYNMKKGQPMVSHKTICRKLFIILFTGQLTLLGRSGISTSTETSNIQPVPQSESEVPRISPGELKERLDKKEKIKIVDVRSVKEFDAQHIAGAISIPLHQVLVRQKELPREQETVFYCT